MDESAPNPYQPPTSTDFSGERAPAFDGSASRSSRLWASLIDGLLISVIVVPAQYFAGVYQDFPKISQPPFPQSLLWLVAGIAITLAVQGRPLVRSAQTIGKKVMNIQIVNVSDGRPAPFERIVLWRLLPPMLVAQIPYVGGFLGMVNVLLIFRQDRRCGHDHLARTRVVDLAWSTARRNAEAVRATGG